MRVRFPRLLLIAAFAFVAPDLGASAETVGGFHFEVPQGWTPCKIEIEGFNQFYCNADSAVIGIQSPATAVDARTLANHDLADVEIVNEQEAVFAGNPGHVVIGRIKQGDKFILVAIAATVGAGGARVGLIAAPEAVEASVQAWSALIDQGNFGGEAPKATQKFTVANVGEGCAAVATIDGEQVQIAAGATTEVMLTEGKHEFTWTDSAGELHSATADVPPADTLGASCTVAGTQPQPTPATDIPAVNSDDTAMFNGARAAVKFYRILGNLVMGQNLLDPTPKSDRPMLRVLAERPDDRLGTMHEYTGYLATLEAAVDKAAGDPTKMAALRRLAVVLMAQAGQIGGVPQGCSSQQGQAMLDCVVEDYAKTDIREVVGEWGRTFARIGNAPNPTDGIVELSQLAQ